MAIWRCRVLGEADICSSYSNSYVLLHGFIRNEDETNLTDRF